MRALLQIREKGFEHWGGDTTQAMKTGEALRAIGVEAEVTPEFRMSLQEYDVVHVFGIQDAEHRQAQILNAKSQGKPVALSTIHWDFAHVPAAHYHAKQPGGRLARQLWRIHHRLPYLPWDLKLMLWLRREWSRARNMLEMADVLLPNSHAELEIISQHFCAPWVRAKAMVVPNAAEQLSPGEPPPGLPDEYVLEAAHVCLLKGQAKLIRALNGTKLPLVLAGATEEPDYGRLCQKLAVERDVTLLGHVPYDRMGGLYAHARVHALPTLGEVTGLVTLEAAACGVNCVVSFHGPVAEYFGPDVWYCDPLDEGSIRDAVLAAWDAPRSHRLQERILRDFTWRKAAEATLAAYERITR